MFNGDKCANQFHTAVLKWHYSCSLAKSQNVIVVSSNYRLSAFGFEALTALVAEDPHASTGNAGIQDQAAAMKWIQANIGKYGGDPARVTIFGESAGGMSVCAHLVRPQSLGLFSRAVMESGACDGAVFRNLTRAVRAAREHAKAVGCDLPDSPQLLACLRNVPAGVLLRPSPLPEAHVEAAAGSGAELGAWWALSSWSPTVDRSPAGLPDQPIALIRRGAWANNASIIFGTNRDEGTVLLSCCDGTARLLCNWHRHHFRCRAGCACWRQAAAQCRDAQCDAASAVRRKADSRDSGHLPRLCLQQQLRLRHGCHHSRRSLWCANSVCLFAALSMMNDRMPDQARHHRDFGASEQLACTRMALLVYVARRTARCVDAVFWLFFKSCSSPGGRMPRHTAARSGSCGAPIPAAAGAIARRQFLQR